MFSITKPSTLPAIYQVIFFLSKGIFVWPNNSRAMWCLSWLLTSSIINPVIFRINGNPYNKWIQWTAKFGIFLCIFWYHYVCLYVCMKPGVLNFVGYPPIKKKNQSHGAHKPLESFGNFSYSASIFYPNSTVLKLQVAQNSYKIMCTNHGYRTVGLWITHVSFTIYQS